MSQSKRITKNINGVLLLNKDLGMSSNRALQQTRFLLQAAKAGHTGSLDPLASGVLPLCFGEATKFSRFLLEADKTYEVTAKLGVITTSGDAEGEIIATNPVPEYSRQQILDAVSGFIGAGEQVPTMFSALKHNGQPLYKLAREGINIERPARPMHIYHYQLLAQTSDTLSFSIKCSKGTYIRTLIEDLGKKLGCGAHVIRLHRTQVGPFNIEQAFTFEQLRAMSDPEQALLPLECLLTDLPKLLLSEQDARFFSHGRKIAAPAGLDAGLVRLSDNSEVFLGIAESQADGMLVPLRLVALNKSVRAH